MSNFKIKLNLTQINGAFVTDLRGNSATKKCVCIPIDDAGIYYVPEKGNAYLDLVAWQVRTPLQSGDTHLIKPSLTKEQSQLMSQEQKAQIPTVGNLHPFGAEVTQQPQYQQPQQQTQPLSPVKEDLPF